MSLFNEIFYIHNLSGDDKIDETVVALPLSYGPHIQEDHRDSNPDPPFQDVVPSAFVTKLSKVAGDKIEESPAVVIGGQGSNLLGPCTPSGIRRQLDLDTLKPTKIIETARPFGHTLTG
jgi:hypothetical protein